MVTSDIERYVQMACACGAEWVEDRLEPEATCPWCSLQQTWDQMATSDRLLVVGPGFIDLRLGGLQTIVQACSFVATDTTEPRCRYDCTIWSHLFASAAGIWEITLEATSFKGEERLRSMTFVCRLGGTPILFTSLMTGEHLILLLAGIAHAMQSDSDERTPLAEGVFCGAPLEPAT